MPQRIINKPAQLIKEIQPAQYKEITREKLVEKGGYIVDKEIICPEKLTAKLIADLEKGLVQRGYAVGGVPFLDANLGETTRISLEEFQKRNSLPIGHVNIETLNAMGIAH